MAQAGRITSIKRQAKRDDRVSIYIDGKFVFSLHDSQLVSSGLKIGKELSGQEINKWKNESDFAKAYDKTLNFVTIRPRSQKEINDYLWRKQVEESLKARIVERLKERGYIDDEKFAQLWVRSRSLAKPTSRRKLELELRQKGVSSEKIKEALSSSKDFDERTALQKIIAKKKKNYDDPQKLIAYLARQGFGYDDIKHELSDQA